MNRRTQYCLALLPQLLFLGYLVAGEEWSLRRGTLVLLETGPVWSGYHDPLPLQPARSQRRDVLVTMLDPALCRDAEDDLGYGDLVYVVLEPHGDVHVAAAYTSMRPDVDQELFLRGRVRDRGEERIRIDYGWNRIDLDAARPARIRVLVGLNGRSVIEEVLED